MKKCRAIIVVFLAGLAAGSVPAATVNWKAATTGDWSVSGNWEEGAAPGNGDDVIITNAGASVTLSGVSDNLNSLILSRTLTFTNWNTSLSATTVTILSNGVMTLPAAFTNSVMSNRVWIVCSDITIETGGSINADGRGYAYGTPTIPTGQGPGGGPSQGDGTGGGGHGGAGGSGYAVGGGGTYGSAAAPLCPGSGGGGSIPRVVYGAHGGGAALIEATGAVVVHGTISANGNSDGTGGRGGGGSGGSVYITCNTFAGTNGVIRANGGTGTSTGGAGGGGRIAVMYETNAQASLPKPTVRFSADRALGYGGTAYSGLGSLCFPDMALMDSSWMAHNGVLNVTNFTSWSVPSLLVTNGFISIPTAGFDLRTTNNLTIMNTNGILQMSVGAEIRCGGDLTVTNGGALYVYAGLTNDTSPYYGTLVAVTGDVWIATNSWIYPSSQNTNGAAPVFRMRDISIAAGGGINADAQGFLRGINSAGYSVNGYGPGRGAASVADGSGAGYGGRGGRSLNQAARGITYGDTNAPTLPGSGGAGRTGYAGAAGGNGGGLVRIEAVSNITVNGTITADGQQGTWHGGGSGGGIYLSCLNFIGVSNALLGADGGNRNGANDGGGGGGRIAVWRVAERHFYQGDYSVSNGLSYTSDPEYGTVTLVDVAPPWGTISNNVATNISATNVWMIGNLVATGLAPNEIYCYWGQTDGGTNRNNWANTNYMGTNDIGLITNQVYFLTGETRYYYRFYSLNLYGDDWGEPVASFSTSGGPHVDNDGGATNVTLTSATLRGEVTGGDPRPDAYIYWGVTDGGTNKSAWSNEVAFGPATNWVFSTNIGVIANQTYYYRCYASNTWSNAWAATTTNFTISGPSLSISDVTVTERDGVNTTNAVFVVTLSATSITDVTVFYAASNGTATAGSDFNATNGTLVIAAGQFSNTVTVVVNGDGADEYPSENFYVNLSAPTNATISDGTGEAIVIDNDDVKETRTWTGTGNWTSATNWSPTGMPSSDDDVILASGTATLSNSMTIASFIVSNSTTLIFTNWTTKLTVASNATVRGTLTLPAAFTNSVMSNRVWIACSNFTLETSGSIAADGKGYAKGTPTRSGQGPGGGGTGGNGGGGGGHGASGSGGYNGGAGSAYDSSSAPVAPGSGGGGCDAYPSSGADGGGAVLIEATGAATVHGTISANGNSDGTGGRGGGGSGGAIYITCNTFAGTNGVIRADGGTGTSSGGAGGGGRIAVVYDTNAQASLPKPSVRFSANRASGYSYSGIGTIYFSDVALMNWEWMAHNGVLTVPNFTSWSVPSLLVTNGFIRIPTADFTLQTTNDLTIMGTNGILQMPTGGNITCGRDLVLTNGGILYVYAAATNDTTPYYGSLISVARDIHIASNSWIYPYSKDTNGAAPVFRMRDIVIAAGGGINADTLGFLRGINSAGYGPGRGYAAANDASGAGYGGQGGRSANQASRGATYGSSNAPVLPGSGGAGRTGYVGMAGGNGGGLVRIEAERSVTVDGTITADGGTGNNGGGSGGGIYISCINFGGGAAGLLGADGGARGSANEGGGGGGRIAVWRFADQHTYQGNYSVSTGLSYTSDPELGTVVLLDMPLDVNNDGGASNVTMNSAWLNGNLTSTGGAPSTVVYIYWGLTDGGTTNSSWANTNNLGVLSIGLFSNQVSSLTAGTTYYYRCYATNSAGEDWAPATTNFTTLALPTVDNDGGASNVTANSAWLNGNLTSTGGASTTVYIYWGLTDGGTTNSSWGKTNNLGALSTGLFSNQATSLSAGITYYYRCYATNSEGGSWAATTTNFATLATTPALNNDGGASNVTMNSAWLNGNLTSTGGSPTTVYIYWGLTDGGTTNNSWGKTNNLGALSTGLFSNQVTSLSSETTYYYRCYATNSTGESWAPTTTNFTTFGATPVVNNGAGALGVTSNSAWLNGNLVSTGGSPTTVYIYWGLTDGGTTNSSWGKTNNLGALSVGLFSNQVTSLSAGITYYYRCYATNSTGANWAPTTTNFTTLMGVPVVNNDGGASNVTSISAWLNGNLVSTGGAPTTVYIYWGLTDGGTTNSSWGKTNNLGVLSTGLFSSQAAGLSASTTYYYRCYATNSGGASWAPTTTNFTTPSPLALPFDDDFESYPNGTDLNGTNGWTATANNFAVVQTGVVYAGVQAARITNAVMDHSFSDASASNVWTRLYLRPVFGEDVIPTNNARTLFYVNNSGVVVAYNGTNAVTLSNTPIVSNTWVRFVSRSDYVQKKWWLWLDGASIAANFNFYSTNAALYTRLGFDESGETNAAYVDNIRVSANAPSLPGVSFSAAADSQSESLTTITGTVFLSWAATDTITVTFTNTAGTAGAADFSGAGTITFNPGETNKDFTFTIVNDTEDEYPNETVVFSLIGPSNSVLGAVTNFTYTIDDTADGIALPFVETFETLSVGNLNNQHGWTATDSVAQTNVVYAGSKAASSTNSGEVSHAFSDSSSLARTEIYIQPQFGDAPTNVPGDSTAAFYVGTNGIVTAYNGTNATVLSNDPIGTNAWVRFAWLSDYTQKKWSLWLNGTNIAQDFSFYSTNKTSYTKLRVGDGTDQAYLDSIFITVPPTVNNHTGATQIAMNSATLNGNLTSTGGAPTSVSIFWGLSDGGTNIAGWGNTNSFGALPKGVFSTNITGLLSGSNYYYRSFASNMVDSAWAASTTNFTTIVPPVVNNNTGATQIAANSATLNGNLVSTGTPPTAVWIFWGTADGGTNIAGWANTRSFGALGVGVFSTNVTGLSAGSNYYYRSFASNTAARVWAPSTTNFATPGGDPNADNDGDGVINTNETIAGTDPNSAGSYMRITNMTVQGADINLTFWAGANRTIKILAANDAASNKTEAGSVATGGSEGTNYWTDTNAVNLTSQRFYSISVSFAGSGYTNTEEWAMFAQSRRTGQWYMASVPVQWNGTNFNRLDSTLGAQLTRGLTGGADDSASDNIWLQTGGAWVRYWLSTTNVWKDTNNAPATVEIKPADGFWIKRYTNGPPSSNAVFTGRAHTNSTPITFSSNVWKMFAWPYANARHESNGVNKGWAFSTAGAQGGYSWQIGDNLIGVYSGTWFAAYMQTNGRWYVRGTKNAASIKLEPGKAYNYLHRGTGMTWTAEP